MIQITVSIEIAAIRRNRGEHKRIDVSSSGDHIGKFRTSINLLMKRLDMANADEEASLAIVGQVFQLS